jgi:tetratricopeptide (TPR) repeat protein
MREITLMTILLAVPLICFAQDTIIQASPQYKEEKKREEIIQRAIDYAAGGDFEGAYQEFKNVSEKKTQLTEKYLKLLGDILNKKIDKEVGLHLFKGLQLLRNTTSQNPVEAINEFKWVMNAEPNCELAYFIFGDICYHSACADTEESKNIIPAFKKAIEIDPNFALAHYWLAFSYYMSSYMQSTEQSYDVMSKCKLVVEHYDKAIELEPSLKDIPYPKEEPGADALIDVCRKALKGEIPTE